MVHLVLGVILKLDLDHNLSRQQSSQSWWFKGFAIAISCAIIACLTIVSATPSMAALPTKSAIKDARIILRNALPIDNDVLRDVQRTLEQMPRQANLNRWSNLKRDIETIAQTLNQNQSQLIYGVADINPPDPMSFIPFLQITFEQVTNFALSVKAKV